MNKTRVEAFSDAVIAIIMTIMILEIKTPQVGVLAGLIENIPYFLSFIVSFIFICIAWYNHHYIGVILSEAVIWYLNVPKEGDRLEC